MDRHITLYYAPQTRSLGALILLEELGADYGLQLLNMKAGEQRSKGYLAINPMGKVPAVVHGGALVTEQAAICIYLADLYPEAALAPALGDALRGPYLRWMVFYGSCFEPALIDRAMQREPGEQAMSPYGGFDTVMGALSAELAKGPYMLGETFSALDVLWGTALAWTTAFKLVPSSPLIDAYIARVGARPAGARARAKDAMLAAAQA